MFYFYFCQDINDFQDCQIIFEPVSACTCNGPVWELGLEPGYSPNKSEQCSSYFIMNFQQKPKIVWGVNIEDGTGVFVFEWVRGFYPPEHNVRGFEIIVLQKPRTKQTCSGFFGSKS